MKTNIKEENGEELVLGVRDFFPEACGEDSILEQTPTLQPVEESRPE